MNGNKIAEFMTHNFGTDWMSSRHILRQAVSRLRSLPNFIIVGAQKAGTTSLFDYLMQHDAIIPPVRKEIHYFDLNAGKDISWYKAHFPLRRQRRITGEASPYYLFHPLVAKRIRNCVPSVKIIILLRNPLERARSHYFHSLRRGTELLSPTDAFLAEEARMNEIESTILSGGRALVHQHNSYIARSCYSEQVRRYYENFDRNQIKIVTTENLSAHTQACLDEIFDFLGVDTQIIKDLIPRNGAGKTNGFKIPNHLKDKVFTDVLKLEKITGENFSRIWIEDAEGN